MLYASKNDCLQLETVWIQICHVEWEVGTQYIRTSWSQETAISIIIQRPRLHSKRRVLLLYLLVSQPYSKFEADYRFLRRKPHGKFNDAQIQRFLTSKSKINGSKEHTWSRFSFFLSFFLTDLVFGFVGTTGS